MAYKYQYKGIWHWITGGEKRERIEGEARDRIQNELDNRRNLYTVNSLGNITEAIKKKLRPKTILLQSLHDEFRDMQYLIITFNDEDRYRHEDIIRELVILMALSDSIFHHINASIERDKPLEYKGQGFEILQTDKTEIRHIRTRMKELMDECEVHKYAFTTDINTGVDFDLVFIDRGFQKIILQSEKLLEELELIER